MGPEAYAFANANTGILSGFASAAPAVDAIHYAEFSTTIRETITFRQIASGIGYLNWHWDGSSSSAAPYGYYRLHRRISLLPDLQLW